MLHADLAAAPALESVKALPANGFKSAIGSRQLQLGLWLATADAYVAEVAAGTGFDWLLIDAEHAPNDLRSVLAQVQAIASASNDLPARVPTPHPVVRVPVGDAVLIKQVLELGVQNLLVPMVETPQQAEGLVRATRYPPHGVRGMGSGMARSSRWFRYPNYVHEADAQQCLLVQVESPEGLTNVAEIAAVPGVDGVFFGPADLSASMSLRGQPGHPEVMAAIEQGMDAVQQAGKAVGILDPNETRSLHWINRGACFVALGVDISLLSQTAQALVTRFRTSSDVAHRSDGAY